MQHAQEHGHKSDQERSVDSFKPSASINSNYEKRKEDKMVHQLLEDMLIVKQESDPINTTMEEAISCHVFC